MTIQQLLAVSLVFVAVGRASDVRPAPVRFEVKTSAYERNSVAACLVLEAANQGEVGMRAVMAVIVNRSRDTGKSFYHVAARPGHFSCFNSTVGFPDKRVDIALRLAREQPAAWQMALDLFDAAAAGNLSDPTGGARFYHHVSIRPYWVPGLTRCGVIGAHAFYRKA
jgi:spore germination cell wall hydrolase CwlJ-like protein